MKSQRKTLKQTSLDQFSSPVKKSSSPAKPPPSSQIRTPLPKKRLRRSSSSGNDSDGLRNIRLEHISDSADSSSESSYSGSESSASIKIVGARLGPRRTQTQLALKSESEEDPSDDDIPLTSLKARGKRPARDSDDDEDEDPQPKRRRLAHRKTIVAHENSDEDSEVDIDELDSDSVLPTRLRTRGTKSSHQKALEKYASKRKKGKGTARAESEDEENKEEESESEEPSPRRKLFKGSKPSKYTHVSSEDEDEDSKEGSGSEEDVEEEDDWIVEDDGLAAPRLPSQFSMEIHQDLGHQFKKIFQLLVHTAIQPKSNRKRRMEELLEDDYFSAPLSMFRRKLAGLRDSGVASSVWRPDFKRALERFPEFSLTVMDFSVPGCDACHLGGRTSTRKGAVSGKPYERLGFENQKRSSADKQADKRLKKQFDLGRFCAARTEVYHQFCHWEYDTFKLIDNQIEEVKSGTFCKVAYAGGRKPPKDMMDADGILEWLDERGLVDQQWQLVKAMMDRARNLESEGRRGDD